MLESININGKSIMNMNHTLMLAILSSKSITKLNIVNCVFNDETLFQ
jgi:hypothetical protein